MGHWAAGLRLNAEHTRIAALGAPGAAYNGVGGMPDTFRSRIVSLHTEGKHRGCNFGFDTGSLTVFTN